MGHTLLAEKPGTARTGTTRRLARLNAPRREIQALRALAVLAVVLYHLWPLRLPGGYVGVDVFFAISGFLIIGHLLREVDRTGRVSLLQFWARRARRLLPASLLVLAVTGVATLVWVPSVLWQRWFQEIAASALYVQNWVLAASSVDYLGADLDATPAQHFWSLSVEEQFYIFWPLVIVGALLVSRRMRRATPRRTVATVLVVLVVASFAASVLGVATDPSPTYFASQARAWEFGAGGLLAVFAASPLAGREVLRSVVGWLGLAALVVTLLAYTPSTPFPGVAALLPVLGTLAVIWAGSPRLWWSPSTIANLRPVQWIGGVSYSLYLWHWPFIVILPFVIGHDLGTRSKIGILVLAGVLAWATKLLVEDPARSGFLASRPAWLSLTSTLAATALVAGLCGVVYVRTGDDIDRAAQAVQAAIAEAEECLGAAAVTDADDCPQPFAANDFTNAELAATDIGDGVKPDDSCKQAIAVDTVIACEVGDTTAPTMSLALVGDSHAGHFLEALDLYGSEHGVKFTTYLKTICDGTGTEDILAGANGGPETLASCANWGAAVTDEILADPSIDGVVYSNFTRLYVRPVEGMPGRPLQPEDLTTVWQRMLDAGKTVVAVRDVPGAGGINAPQCVAQNIDVDDPCATPRDIGELQDDPMVEAAAQLPAVSLVDLDDILCGADVCHSLIGGLIVYFDDHHLTATFSRTLADVLGERVVAGAQ